MISAILVTHGNLANELLDTAKSIFGQFSDCYPVSNERKTRDGLVDEINEIITSNPSNQFVVFVDFFGGSTCHAALIVQRDHPDVVLISGINLPMLLAFLYLREKQPFEKLPQELIKRAQASVTIIESEEL